VDFFWGGGCDCLPFSLSSVFYSWLFSLLVFLYTDESDSKQRKSIGKANHPMDLKNLKKKIRKPEGCWKCS
jgi:hypothetical protein